MERKIILYSILIITFLINILYPAEPYIPQKGNQITESWRWRHFNELDKFGIRCISEDNNHNMWFGGDNSIIRYDGLNWEEMYKFKNKKRDYPTNIIFSTSDGRIFTNSLKGITLLQNNEWSLFLPNSRKPNLTIRDITELHDGSVILVTNLAIIHILKSNKLDIYTTKDQEKFFKELKSDAALHFLKKDLTVKSKVAIYSVLQTKDKTLWFALGYTRRKTGKIITAKIGKEGHLKDFKLFYSENKKDKFYDGVTLFQDNSGAIWLLLHQFDKGITIFKNGQIKHFKLSDKFGGDDMYVSIVQANDNTIFIGGLGRFFTLKDNKWTEYTAPTVPIPSSNRIIFFKDSKGDIWLAGHKNEVFRLEYTDRNWSTYENLNFQDQAKDSTRWFIDIEGKIIKNIKNSWLSYSEKDGIMSHPVRVKILRDGQIWAIGSHHGIASSAYFENNKWTRTLYPNLSWGIDSRAIYEDFSGTLWLGASIDYFIDRGQKGGVIKITDPSNNKTDYQQKYMTKKKVSAYGISESKDKKIWIPSTSTKFIKNDTIRSLTSPYKLRSSTDCSFTDKDSILWIGSRNYGIFKYDGKTWTNITMDDGLYSNSITNINVISDSAIWVSTAKDISFFDGRSWTNRVFPPEMNIYKEGGDIRDDINGNLWINKSSRKWYRRILNNEPIKRLKKKGFRTVFYHRDHSAPQAKIIHYEEKVSQIGNTTIIWTGKDPFEKTSVENLQYSYRIDNGNWSPFSIRSSHFFSNLSSGDHQFEVRSRDQDFNIGPTDNIEFYVLYPFYLRPAFLIPIFLLLALSGILISRIVKKREQLKQAKKETDEILRNIKQGLFLLDSDFRLGSQFSRFLKTIFKEENLTNKYFIDLIKDKTTKENVEAITSYLEIFFQNDIDIKMLDDLNPFDEIKFEYPALAETKYFSFRFRRIISMEDSSKIESLIVVVQDITEQITLGKQLEEASQDATKKMNWLLDILHVEPGLLQEFLNSSEAELQKIFEILDNPKILEDPIQYLETIYRSMHLLKGNAGLLELNSFADETHRVEDIISQYQKDGSVKENDIKILYNMIEKISTSIQDVLNLLDKLSAIHEQMRTKSGDDKNQLKQSLSDLVKRISKKEKKNAELKSDKFDFAHFPKNKQLTTREVLTQLLKNSIVHGIEPKEERLLLNKNKIGTIEISSFKNSKGYGFKIKDDGRGIQIAKLKSKLINSQKYTEEEIKSWNDTDIAMSIFFSGISTADNININAGRGVGLDAVKKKVESFGGKIEINFKENEFCEFTITFPIKKKA